MREVFGGECRQRAWSGAACAIALVAWFVVLAPPFSASSRPQQGTPGGTLPPEVEARLVGIERAQGIALGALAAGGQIDEADVLRRMTARISTSPASDPEAEKGVAALGPTVGEILRRTHAFHREVVAVFTNVPAPDRRRALDDAIARYRSGGLALPDAPKDMTILYDHPYTSFVPPKPPETEPHRELRYPKLTGFVWSSHWYELAVIEPLQDLDDERARGDGLAIVEERFKRKLSGSTSPDAFPTELPLAPAIAPGLVAVHERAAAIVDNLNILTDVIADVLVHPGVKNRRAEVDSIVTQFMDRQYRCVQADEWIVVALRHSIFDQGGFALQAMAGYERNAFSGGHGQHYAVRRTPPPCDPK